MNGKQFFLLLLITIGFLKSWAQMPKTYEAEWKRVDALIQKQNLPKSALEEVKKIFTLAKAENQPAQQIKALIYRIALQQQTRESNLVTSIKEVEEAVQTSGHPVSAILQSLLAELYWTYYNNNRWKLYNRTATVAYKQSDIETWSPADFHQKIGNLYLQSIKNDIPLKRTRLIYYEAILQKGNVRHLRPTLYDLLAHRALDYFKNTERDVQKPAYAFEIKDPEAFAPARTFIAHRFVTRDSLSLHHKALQLFQKLIAYHINDADERALIDVDIERLQFVYTNSVHEAKDSLYVIALKELTATYNNPHTAQAVYLLAAYYNTLGNTYQPLKDTGHRYKKLEALALLEKVVADTTEKTEGWYNSKALLQQLLAPEFLFTLEKINVPGQPFRTLVNYKNIGTLHFKLLRATTAVKDSLTRSTSYWRAFAKMPAFKTWQQALPATHDLQYHAVEVKIDALPVGEYLLIASNATDFRNDSVQAGLRLFQVSNISYLAQNDRFFVLHRETGQPLANAKANVYTQQYDYSVNRNIKKPAGTYTTNASGYFRIDSATATKNNYYITFTHNGDSLQPDEAHYNYYYRTNEKPDNEIPRIFFFTDRSIYRPGQTVYFKGLAIKKTGNDNRIAAAYTTKIFLENANDEDIDSVQVTTNEFGSFAGSFILPQNGLTGSFNLYDDEMESSTSFSVEEYKRPQFYVELEAPKTAYRLGDSVTVTGTAKAYAGNNISGGKVTYRVVRQARFLYPWLVRSWLPTTPSTEIVNGQVTTGSDGTFQITFNAAPDRSIKRELEPYFTYTVSADVTDLNGETRSSTTTLSTGYQSLLLKVKVPERIRTDSLRQLYIRTENWSGQSLGATTTVRFTQLEPEKRLIRPRYWQQPDQFLFSKEQYIQLFPHDEYAGERDYKNWPLGKTIYTQTDSTRTTGAWTLQKVAIPPGYYQVEITTRDREGKEVKEIRYLELYEETKNIAGIPVYLWTGSTLTPIEPGEKVNVQIGSAAENVFVIQEEQKQQGPPQYSFLNLNNEIKKVSLPVTESDRGGYGLTFLMVKHNRFYQHQQVVPVLWSNKELDVTYKTFRNKTLPGSYETWSVTINGHKGDAAAAEILASMYDASLDAIKKHNWNTPDIWPRFSQRYGSWSSNYNFTAIQSSQRWYRNYYPAGYTKLYDRLLQPTNLVYELRNQYYRNESARSRQIAQEVMAAPPSADRLDEVVVTGMAPQKRTMATGAATSVTIRGASSLPANALIVVDGVIVSSTDNIDPDNILTTTVLKGTEATAIYSAQAANGVIIITTKSGKPDVPVQIRKNFNETAFFFPQLQTDKNGVLTFSFTTPEALTTWKLQTLAHTKEGAFGISTKELVTQKDLMVQPNFPRFLRQGDRLEIPIKIVNLSQGELTGQVELELLDATTNQSVSGWFQNVFPNQYFTVAAGGSEVYKFPIEVPFLFNNALTYRIVARAGNFSDGEERTLPVLSNKILVTETLPLPMKGNGTKTFRLNKLLQSGQSETVQHQALTVEYTSNPAWYAVQALPYLMQYPYECAEQTWNRYYANALASHIIAKAPRIEAIFKKWKTVDTAALLSNLQKNEELKSILLQETPWVLAAATESEQKKNIALLFDLVRMRAELSANLESLKSMQSPNGGFVWFKGGPDDRYITQYILGGIGHLKKLGINTTALDAIVKKALPYLDKKLGEDFRRLVKSKVDLTKQQPQSIHTQYLYVRSFFNQPIADTLKAAYTFFKNGGKKYWAAQPLYTQAQLALALHRTGERATATAIVKSLKENSILNEELGRYWVANTFGRSWYWWHAPIETQSLLIETFNEVTKDTTTVDELKTWLLKNKHTTSWRTTTATAEACYALLLTGSDWLQQEPLVTIQLGKTTISNTTAGAEAGTGYFKQTIAAPFVLPAMGNITVSVQQPGTTSSASWGAVYWQYFEDIDKITTAKTPLQVVKKVFIETHSDRGPVLTLVKEGDAIPVGAKLKVRIELRADRDMEYIHMKDMRASALEPVNVLSGYKWQGGLGYYESTRDASTNFFFNTLRKGTYVFEYPLFATHAGVFSNGITTIQSMYAPEFSSRSESIKLTIE